MRATRDLLRRRLPLTRQRAALLAHVQHTTSQDHLPAIGKQRASKAQRDGVAARFPAPAVQKRVAVDLALMDDDDQLRSDVELAIVQTAKPQNAQTLSRLHAVPGIGKIVRVVVLDEIHAITRFPRVQDVVSSCRLVKGAQASAGNRSGTSGAKIGQADRTWAFAEAAGRFLRNHPVGQTSLARFEHKQGKGQAWTLFAHT